MPKTAILVACLIGLGCCILAVLDARSQQTEDSPTALPGAAGIAATPALHRMRGWTSHPEGAAPTTVRVDSTGRILG